MTSTWTDISDILEYVNSGKAVFIDPIEELREELQNCDTKEFEEFSKRRIQKLERIQNIKRIESEEEKKKLHEITKELCSKQFLFSECLRRVKTQKYSLIKGKYEILGVDFCDDSTYVLLRRINKETELLFGGDVNKLLDCIIEPSTISEYVRRGYFCDDYDIATAKLMKQPIKTNETFMNKIFSCCKTRKNDKQEVIGISWKRIQEVHKELWKEIVKIPISEFMRSFSFIEKVKSASEVICKEEIFEVTNDWQGIYFDYNGILDIEVDKLNEFSMEIIFYRSYTKCLNTKTILNENEKTLKKHFKSEYGTNEYMKIIFKLSNEDKQQNEMKQMKIKFNHEEELKIKKIRKIFDEIIMTDEKQLSKFGKCELCHDEFHSIEEIYKIHDEIYCHQSCYQYIKCCKCNHKNYSINSDSSSETIVYIPEIKGFCCFFCCRHIILEAELKQYEKYNK